MLAAAHIANKRGQVGRQNAPLPVDDIGPLRHDDARSWRRSAAPGSDRRPACPILTPTTEMRAQKKNSPRTRSGFRRAALAVAHLFVAARQVSRARSRSGFRPPFGPQEPGPAGAEACGSWLHLPPSLRTSTAFVIGPQFGRRDRPPDRSRPNCSGRKGQQAQTAEIHLGKFTQPLGPVQIGPFGLIKTASDVRACADFGCSNCPFPYAMHSCVAYSFPDRPRMPAQSPPERSEQQ